MARKTDKNLMIAVSLFLAKPQVTGLGNRQVETDANCPFLPGMAIFATITKKSAAQNLLTIYW